MELNKEAVLVLVITFLLAILVFVWMNVINKGTLSIEGDTPFTVVISGERNNLSQNQSCVSSPCDIKLPTGEYAIVLSKDGYEDENRTIEIHRGDTTSLAIEFIFIPTMESVSVPQDLEERLAIEDGGEAFEIVFETENQKQRLDHIDLATGEVVVWAYFDRTLEEPQIWAHPDLTQVLIADQQEDKQVVYQIDGESLERKYLGEFQDIQSIKWDPVGNTKSFIVEDSDGGKVKLWIYNEEKESLKRWPFDSNLDQMLWMSDGKLVFLSQQNLSAIDGETYDDAVDVLTGILTGDLTTSNTTSAFSIGEYDLMTETYQSLHQVPMSFELDFAETVMYSNGEEGQFGISDSQRAYVLLLNI